MALVLKQCELVKGDVHTVVWVPTEYARKGGIVHRHNGDWKVLIVYSTRREVSESPDGFDHYYAESRPQTGACAVICAERDSGGES